MTEQTNLPTNEEELRAPYRTKNPFRVMEQGDLHGSSAGGGKRSSRSGSGAIFMLQGLGALAALAILAALFWMGGEFGESKPADRLVAERACSQAVIRASLLPRDAVVRTTEAYGSKEFWRLSGIARVEGYGSVQEYTWTCGHYISLGVTRVMHFGETVVSERSLNETPSAQATILPELYILI